MWSLFRKKGNSEYDCKLSELKKEINKKDDTSISDSIEHIRELQKLDSASFSEFVIKESEKKNSDFISGLISKTLVMDEEPFSDPILSKMIDNSLRYGSKEDQRSAVLLLKKYKSHSDLLSRYKLVYVKDKKSQKILADLF